MALRELASCAQSRGSEIDVFEKEADYELFEPVLALADDRIGLPDKLQTKHTLAHAGDRNQISCVPFVSLPSAFESSFALTFNCQFYQTKVGPDRLGFSLDPVQLQVT